QTPGQVPGFGRSILVEPPIGTPGNVATTMKSVEPVFTASTTSLGRSMNACPAVYVVMSQWFPTETYSVSSPDWTMAIAPPGCECQPEEPPGTTVIFETTMSRPCSMGRVPWDMYVPRPTTWLEKPTDGVAAPGTALNAANRPTSPSVMTDRRMTRLARAFIRDS